MPTILECLKRLWVMALLKLGALADHKYRQLGEVRGPLEILLRLSNRPYLAVACAKKEEHVVTINSRWSYKLRLWGIYLATAIRCIRNSLSSTGQVSRTLICGLQSPL